MSNQTKPNQTKPQESNFKHRKTRSYFSNHLSRILSPIDLKTINQTPKNSKSPPNPSILNNSQEKHTNWRSTVHEAAQDKEGERKGKRRPRNSLEMKRRRRRRRDIRRKRVRGRVHGSLTCYKSHVINAD